MNIAEQDNDDWASENTRGMQMDDDPSLEEPCPEGMIAIRHIDGTSFYRPAPAEVQAIMRSRFDDFGTTAEHPRKEGFLLHYVENFWDGPHEVKINGDGTYSYSCPYTKRVDIFS